jgi:hypothetical protein
MMLNGSLVGAFLPVELLNAAAAFERGADIRDERVNFASRPGTDIQLLDIQSFRNDTEIPR